MDSAKFILKVHRRTFSAEIYVDTLVERATLGVAVSGNSKSESEILALAEARTDLDAFHPLFLLMD